MKDWRKAVVKPSTHLRETIARVDESGSQIALVVDDDNRLTGILTDGDIRRALLQHQDLSIDAGSVMNINPHTAHVSSSREELLRRMRKFSIYHIPLVDDEGKIAGLANLDQLVTMPERPNLVVLMAGGLGRRLLPLTETVPKPMVVIGSQPILETILESFVDQGFRRFCFTVNYKAEVINKHFGNGERWGVHIDYVREGQRLGTAGALSLIPNTPDEPFIVMNGDVLTRASIDGMLRFHDQCGATATMAVRQHDSELPYGVVHLDGHRICRIDEKPVQQFYVNAGIYILEPSVLSHVPKETFFDMPSLFGTLIDRGEATAAYPVREYWLDIGRAEELERAQREWVEE